MRYYVSIAGVPDQFLEFLGYVLVEETGEFKVYLRHGDLIAVKISNPYLYVDDLNDARILRSQNLMAIPPESESWLLRRERDPGEPPVEE